MKAAADGSQKAQVTIKTPGRFEYELGKDHDQARFEEAARAAGQGCPISGALAGNVEISVEATLDA